MLNVPWLRLVLLFGGTLFLIAISIWVGREWLLTGAAAQARRVGLLVLALLGLLWLTGTTVYRPVRLTCAREVPDLAVNCRLEQLAFGLIVIQSRSVADLEGASVGAIAAFDREGNVLEEFYRVELHTADEIQPLTPYYSIKKEPRAEIAAEITDFIESGRRGPLVVRDHVTPCAECVGWDW